MLGIIFEFLTYLMAIYGVYCLLLFIISHTRNSVRLSGKMKLVLLVKDAEDSIEGVIRKINLDSAVNEIIPLSNMVVVDMGSSDRTVEILRRLKREYGFLEVVEYVERHKIFDSFSGERI